MVHCLQQLCSPVQRFKSRFLPVALQSRKLEEQGSLLAKTNDLDYFKTADLSNSSSSAIDGIQVVNCRVEFSMAASDCDVREKYVNYGTVGK